MMFKLYYNIIRSTYLIYNCIQNKLYNDDNVIKNITESIDNSGCLFIKIVQWTLPRLYSIDIDKKFIKIFSKYYNHCHIHDIDYTKYIYIKDFDCDIEEEYDILNVLGSGSMGQVYKIMHKKSKKYYALKILHPNIEYEFSVFTKLFNIVNRCINIKKYIPISNYNDIFKELYEQIDLNKEVNNILTFKQIHDDSLYIIPDVIKFSKNIIMMTYLEQDDKTELSIFKTKHIFMKLLLYNLACPYYGICHADLHEGNWGIHKNKIIIYDFGYCLKYNIEHYKIVENMVLNKNRIEAFSEYISLLCKENNKDYENITEEYKNQIIEEKGEQYTDLDEMYENFFKFILKNKLYISSHCFNGFIASGNLENLTTPDVVSASDKNITLKIVGELIDICESYNIFTEFKEHIKDTYTRKIDNSIFNLDKYEFLKNKII